MGTGSKTKHIKPGNWTAVQCCFCHFLLSPHGLHISCSLCSRVCTICITTWAVCTLTTGQLWCTPIQDRGLEPEQTFRISLSHCLLQQLLTIKAVGTYVGSVIANHRCRPFFTMGSYTGNPQKSLRLLLEVWRGWIGECTGKLCPLIKGGGFRSRSHYTADSRHSHLLEITKWGI